MLKIAKSLVVIAVVAVMAVSATSASWSDTQVVDNNVFTTGTLDLTTTPATALFDLDNMYPGFSSTQSIDITNSGSIDFNYVISAAKDSGSDTLYNSDYLTLKVGTTSGGSEVWSGHLHDLTALSTTPSRFLATLGSETLYFTVALSASADNALQGQTATTSFTFTANQ